MYSQLIRDNVDLQQVYVLPQMFFYLNNYAK